MIKPIKSTKPCSISQEELLDFTAWITYFIFVVLGLVESKE
jgi:hypothetical protein